MKTNARSFKESVFVLSGEELTLPFGEIRSLILTYLKDSKIQKQNERIVTSSLSDLDSISKVTQRAAYCRFGGALISKSKNILSLADQVDKDLVQENRTFAVDSISLTMAECGELGAKIKSKTDARVSLENPDYVFQVEAIPEGLVLGLSSQGYKKFHWRTRRPRARRFFLPSAIYPKLARALVNLSRVKEGESFADPFCGTGSLLIESSLMGMRSIGIEITRWISRGAALNLKHFTLPYESIIRADSSNSLPLREIDGIATDVPYGRASSTKGKKTEKIMEEFLSSASSCMRSSSSRKKYLVIMHPSTVDIKEMIRNQGNSFQLQEQHLLYVHRNLTRAISILERTAA
ncbi:MAG: THUMP domain-containing protein [archaeon]|nr:THUMP domain-containing protein [archaeon]